MATHHLAAPFESPGDAAERAKVKNIQRLLRLEGEPTAGLQVLRPGCHHSPRRRALAPTCANGAGSPQLSVSGCLGKENPSAATPTPAKLPARTSTQPLSLVPEVSPNTLDGMIMGELEHYDRSVRGGSTPFSNPLRSTPRQGGSIRRFSTLASSARNLWPAVRKCVPCVSCIWGRQHECELPVRCLLLILLAVPQVQLRNRRRAQCLRNRLGRCARPYLSRHGNWSGLVPPVLL